MIFADSSNSWVPVLTLISGCSGASYGDVIPVNAPISLFRAFL